MKFILRHPLAVFLSLVGLGVLAAAVGWAIVVWKAELQSLLADQFYFSVVLSIVVLVVLLASVAYCILLERKIAAWVQDRYGPNRVGPYGLFQPIADGLKFLLKEDIIPRNVDKAMFILAPWMIFVVAMIGYAIIPWGGTFRWSWMPAGETLHAQVASIDVGLLYIVAVASLGVYGVVLGGWASNNKYSFYGAMRAAAQMLSYEIPMGLMILTAILTMGTLRLEEMVAHQAETTWTVLYHPAAAVILFITALAEANRAPFDLAEAEQELVGGYHTEYSAMKLALFFLAEYGHMLTTSALMVAMFFGGYLVPGWTWLNESPTIGAMVCRMIVFGAKVGLFIFVYMLVRWTLPRFRFDQLMRVAWTSLVPIGLIMVTLQAVIVYKGWPQWSSVIGNVAVVFLAALPGMLLPKAVTGRQQSLMRRDAMMQGGA